VLPLGAGAPRARCRGSFLPALASVVLNRRQSMLAGAGTNAQRRSRRRRGGGSRHSACWRRRVRLSHAAARLRHAFLIDGRHGALPRPSGLAALATWFASHPHRRFRRASVSSRGVDGPAAVGGAGLRDSRRARRGARPDRKARGEQRSRGRAAEASAHDNRA
jgi:hypothetical protein